MLLFVVVVALGRPTGFTPYPAMDIFSDFSSSGAEQAHVYQAFPQGVAFHPFSCCLVLQATPAKGPTEACRMAERVKAPDS